MSKFDDHPTVRAFRVGRAAAAAAAAAAREGGRARLSLDEAREMCLRAGADDAGAVSIDRPELEDQRPEILRAFPWARTLISIACRMNREPIRSPARSVANLEFHESTDHTNEAARMIAANLSLRGARAVNVSVGFPMEMSGFPGRVWIVSHKPVAVAAGLGRMGIHRNVIHPRFGSFILLGTIVTDMEIAGESVPIEYNPCLDCRLCIAACPVGAISEDGFNFSSCYTHNYREFMGGFTDWAENLADAGSAAGYRRRVSDAESASMWQSLAFGPNYKAAYCLSVCPAGEDVIGPFLSDKGEFVREIVKPLQSKEETVYVQPNSDAEEYVERRFPHKKARRVGGVLRPTTIEGFIRSMHVAFQPGRSKGLDATYHFRFTGAERADCTVTIRDQRLEVRDGFVGTARLRVTADSRSWMKFLRKEAGIARLLLTLRVRIKGDPRLLAAFGKCFPG